MYTSSIENNTAGTTSPPLLSRPIKATPKRATKHATHVLIGTAADIAATIRLVPLVALDSGDEDSVFVVVVADIDAVMLFSSGTNIVVSCSKNAARSEGTVFNPIT